ncbi:HAD hydrolase-like protein [Lipingzhangella sp. LS1_29]|uniref:HAD hydrolase-like protein n=1 Tax=Lipingzhangella rawalii TaxID=2055835 RepID=A0ABU2H2Q6_9ACTN|nr:HAD hydrolase-like protein [Lipingzhangella rawalii]MDS1269572.1 HAD hydrolase-like protein [Lipingzhangella rawalii]
MHRDIGTTAGGNASLQQVEHIVWDWNGTLLDDNHANMAALNQVCIEFGLPTVSLEYWRTVFRRPLRECYTELLGHEPSDAEWEKVQVIYDAEYLRHLPDCGLVPEAPRALKQWSGDGGSQSLLSMASHEHLEPLVGQRGLTPHFTRVDGRRFDSPHDSKAEHLVHHLRGQEQDPSRVVLIGDIDDDAHAASAAGAQAVLVARGLMARERLAATGHPVVDSVAEAVDFLRRLSWGT